MNPTRVLFLDHTARKSGGEIALLNTLANLDRAVIEPHVVLFADGWLADQLRAIRIPTHILPLPGDVIDARKDSLAAGGVGKKIVGVLRHVRALAAEIRRIRPRVVHTNSLKSDLIGGLASRLAGVPCAWHVRDRITAEYLPAKVAAAFRLACRVVPSLVIANSASTLSTLTPGLRRSVVVHDGTNLADAVLSPPPGVPDAPRIGLIGRITRWKGQHVFIQAAAEVARSFPGAKFVIIGAALFDEHDYEAELRRLVADHRLESVVQFAGFRDDIPAAIAGLDIVVHASVIPEPFGQVVIEAMRGNRPVIATRGGGVPEIITHQQTGLLVPMNDAAALANAVLQLARNPDQAARLAAAGRRRVEEAFTSSHTARALAAALLSLCR